MNGTRDPVIYHLACALAPTLLHPQQASRLFMDQISVALQAHVMHAYGHAAAPALETASSHLSPGQLRRATELLAANVCGDLSVADIAAECGLSRSYFIKAFKGSTGKTPHRWLTTYRIERACALLAQGGWSIAAVALACGFADQSHLTRVFTQQLGTTPGMWRRPIGSRGSVGPGVNGPAGWPGRDGIGGNFGWLGPLQAGDGPRSAPDAPGAG